MDPLQVSCQAGPSVFVTAFEPDVEDIASVKRADVHEDTIEVIVLIPVPRHPYRASLVFRSSNQINKRAAAMLADKVARTDSEVKKEKNQVPKHKRIFVMCGIGYNVFKMFRN